MNEREQETQSPDAATRPEADGSTDSEDRVERIVSHSKDTVTSLGKEVVQELRKPTTSAAFAGAVVVGAAVTVGAAETALGAASAYITYRILRRKGPKDNKAQPARS